MSKHSKFPLTAALDKETTELSAALESLTFKESLSTKCTSQPLMRLVTLDPHDQIGKGRPSFDHLVLTGDLISPMHGLTPNAAPSFKPPRMSISSMCSTGTRHGRLSGAGTPIPCLEFVGTYVLLLHDVLVSCSLVLTLVFCVF
jgi:hypothetical protein